MCSALSFCKRPLIELTMKDEPASVASSLPPVAQTLSYETTAAQPILDASSSQSSIGHILKNRLWVTSKA